MPRLESWERLKHSGLIMQAPSQAPENITLTERGRQVARTSDINEIMARTNLRREMLHPLLRASVYDGFAAGHYDTAVRHAFVIVEDTVKADSGIKTEIGVKLIRSHSIRPGGRWPI